MNVFGKVWELPRDRVVGLVRVQKMKAQGMAMYGAHSHIQVYFGFYVNINFAGIRNRGRRFKNFCCQIGGALLVQSQRFLMPRSEIQENFGPLEDPEKWDNENKQM